MLSSLTTPCMTTLAWRPFLDPLALYTWWYLLLIPLAVGIALTYRAVRQTEMNHYLRDVASLSAQIVVGVAALGVASYLVIEVLVPMLAPMPQ